MSEIKSYRDLLVWQKSVRLVTEVYQVTRLFPKEESYGLTSQMRRCAVSIPSNIAEGYGRRATNDYLRHLSIATGSLFELQTQLEIGKNLEFLKAADHERLYELSREIERMLSSLMRKLRET
jgi:four helix bundle protein